MILEDLHDRLIKLDQSISQYSSEAKRNTLKEEYKNINYLFETLVQIDSFYIDPVLQNEIVLILENCFKKLYL